MENVDRNKKKQIEFSIHNLKFGKETKFLLYKSALNMTFKSIILTSDPFFYFFFYSKRKLLHSAEKETLNFF